MHPFFQKNNIVLFLFSLSIGIAGITGILLSTETPKKEAYSPPLSSLSEENDASSSTSPSPLPSASPPAVHLTPPSIATASVQTDTPAPTETTSSPPLVQQTIHASLEILDDRYSLSIPPGSTVYDLMNLAAQKQYITFETKSFGAELGYRVEEINGIASSIKNRKYWIYYINGKKATIGISSYLIHPGDIITWKYEDEE